MLWSRGQASLILRGPRHRLRLSMYWAEAKGNEAQ